VNINHSPEYIALWKSHKRAEWEAVELAQQCEQLRQQVEEAETQAPVLAVAGAPGVATGASGIAAQERGALAQQLERELRRKWELHAEIGADLERVSESLTPAQRRNAEKVLQQWAQQQNDSPPGY
jgi:hypothetical protein